MENQLLFILQPFILFCFFIELNSINWARYHTILYTLYIIKTKQKQNIRRPHPSPLIDADACMHCDETVKIQRLELALNDLEAHPFYHTFSFSKYILQFFFKISKKIMGFKVEVGFIHSENAMCFLGKFLFFLGGGTFYENIKN